MVYSGDEDCGDDVTSGPVTGDEPEDTGGEEEEAP